MNLQQNVTRIAHLSWWMVYPTLWNATCVNRFVAKVTLKALKVLTITEQLIIANVQSASIADGELSSAAASTSSGNFEVYGGLYITTDARRTLAKALGPGLTITLFEYGVSTQVTRWQEMVLKAAARLVVGASKFDLVTPVLRDVLQWLPVPQ